MSEIDLLQTEIFSQKIIDKIEKLEKEYQLAKGYKKNSLYRKLQKLKNDIQEIKKGNKC